MPRITSIFSSVEWGEHDKVSADTKKHIHDHHEN